MRYQSKYNIFKIKTLYQMASINISNAVPILRVKDMSQILKFKVIYPHLHTQLNDSQWGVK